MITSKIGALKFYVERLRGYMAWVSSLMVVDVWRRSNGLSIFEAILILIVIACIIILADMKLALRGEMGEALKRNPEWVELRQDIARIEAEVKKIGPWTSALTPE